MIGTMHEKTNSPAFKIIFTLVSLSFVLGGLGGTFLGGNNGVVKVNGEEISQQAFNAERGRQQNMLNSQYGAEFWDRMDNPEYAKEFNRSVIGKLVDEQLLRQFSQDLGLGISAEQIKQEIVNTPSFQESGKFNNNYYQQTLRNNGLSADGYAALVQEGMLMSQLQEGIINSDFSVPAQRELLAQLLLQKRHVRMATFPIAGEAARQTASTEELQAYYNANKAMLKAPEKLAVEYVTINPKAVESKVAVSDEQIETYYNTNKAQYQTQGESRFAHIQLANAEEAQAALQAVKNGENFATVAKNKSVDSLSANNGGDLGWTKAGTFPKAFEDAANALSVDQVSEPVQVDGAFHIIKLLDRKEASQIPMESVKEQITKIIREDLILTEYASVAREMANKASENASSLETVAQVAGLNIEKTAVFTADNIPEALQNERIVKALFDGDFRQSGLNSEGIDLGDSNNPSTVFMRVSQFEPEREQTFEEAKNAVEQAVKTEKAVKTLTERTDNLVASLTKGEDAEVNFGQKQELMFAQAQAQVPVLTKAIFAMPKPADKANYLATRAENGDFVVVELNKVVEGDLAAFQAFAPQFEQADRMVLNQELMNDLRERAKIEVNEEFLEQLESSN